MGLSCSGASRAASPVGMVHLCIHHDWSLLLLVGNPCSFTDSNGREMQQRQVNFRPTWNLTVEEPVAGNYYPVNAITYIKGVNDPRQFTILTGALLLWVPTSVLAAAFPHPCQHAVHACGVRYLPTVGQTGLLEALPWPRASLRSWCSAACRCRGGLYARKHTLTFSDTLSRAWFSIATYTCSCFVLVVLPLLSASRTTVVALVSL
jgi:hypothetical protein